jgi:hypothetical protein
MSDKEKLRATLARTLERDVPALAGGMTAESLRPFRVATDLLKDPARAAQQNANALLARAGELALVPFMEAQGMTTADSAWAIDEVVATANELRRGTLLWLEPLLADKSELPPDAGAPKPKGPPTPAKRVCDAAFLTLTRVLVFTNDELDPKLDEAKLMTMSHGRRDAFIGGIQRTWTYRRARGEDEDE